MKDKQMEVIQEAAGECLHEFVVPKSYKYHSKCIKCGHVNETTYDHFDSRRPSPDDLNALFGYAEKLGIVLSLMVGITTNSVTCAYLSEGANGTVYDSGNNTHTLADALRSALVKAIEGRKA